MADNKKIAIIATHSFGYIDFLVNKLNSYENVDLVYINIDAIPFKYKNKLSRFKNSVLKLFSFCGLKEKNRTDFIKKALLSDQKFDQILVIRPDKLQKEALIFLRENTVNLISFFFDGIENFTDKKKTLSFFDTIYSYDKKDVEDYNFTFLTNYIYDDKIEKKEIKNLAFNIMSFDQRFSFLEKIASYLTQKKISFLFIVKKDKPFKHDTIQISKCYLPINEVKDLIASSLVLLDLQQKNQNGLSFRIFEALGYSKKLITNNQDVVNYDFYNPNNIFVVTENDVNIPIDFFETEYMQVNSETIKKYTLERWIFTVFGV
ncbi:hypothetical protein BC749_102408 [Flavobacterium araucananum]|uniref:Lipopolysaccharide core biosynthesis protein rfaS n=1 Tax=Flavobacterium araucananum TaxID=946678 RepID=A0A227P9R5_9FLAO|nr:hypothetical protein [Flavobacterium araucananum]OXG06502.1 hypothetical protein B0A64_10330 [Flavobacterium araucananum]PWK00841.1 hypothetical protein BC749_102408 [Flavobacterium araucananum]